MNRTTITLCALALLGIACYAWARTTTVVVGQVAAAAACTAPGSGSLFWDDFDGSSLCNASFTSNCQEAYASTSGAPDFDYASPGSPAENTACTYSLRVNPAGAMLYAEHDLGGAQDRSKDINIYAYVYVAAATISDYSNVTLMAFTQSSGYVGDIMARLAVYKSTGTNYYLRVFSGANSTSSSANAISIPGWYSVRIHLNGATPASSYLKVDGGSDTAFTRIDTNNARYLMFGTTATVTYDASFGYAYMTVAP